MARAPLFTWLKNKFYTKTEIDSKMDGKAPNTVVSSTSNGLMIATDKEKLDTVEVGANNTVVDGSMSATSSNPVQNKTVKAELDSLNNAITNKSDIGHTHTTLARTAYIAADEDLNNYTIPGFYIASAPNTTTLLNKPSNLTGGGIRLEVLLQGNGVTQIIRVYHFEDEYIKMYFRHYYTVNEVWTSWQQVNTTIID